MIEAKPVIDKKYWILKKDNRKIGAVEAEGDGYTVRIDDQIVFCRDLKGIKYIFYQNGFVEITADSTEFKEYDQFRAMYGKIRSFPGHTFRQMINRATFIHFAGM